MPGLQYAFSASIIITGDIFEVGSGLNQHRIPPRQKRLLLNVYLTDLINYTQKMGDVKQDARTFFSFFNCSRSRYYLLP
jgi:hypothetical protein